MIKKNKFNLLIPILFLTLAGLIFVLGYSFKGHFDRSSIVIKADEIIKEEKLINNELTDQEEKSQTEKEINIPEMPIFMYHHIRDYDKKDDAIGFNLSVPPSSFSNQLDSMIEKGYTTVNFQDIENGNMPDKPIMLTFDDGYQNFYTNAYPELKKRNMKAVVFVISGFNSGDYLTREQILDLSQNNIEIGSHTISHPDLSIVSTEKAQNEISESKRMIESIIGKTILSFCYPAGKYNEKTIEAVRNEYKYAVTTNPGVSTFENHFELNRRRVNNDTNINAYLK